MTDQGKRTLLLSYQSKCKRLQQILDIGNECEYVICPECNGKKIFPPCEHIGCYQHVTHPCEKCGRVEGKCKNCNGMGKIKCQNAKE